MKIKSTIEIETLDIPSLYAMNIEEYRGLLSGEGFFYVDQDGVLRSTQGSYPLATTREQMDILIEELQRLRAKTEPKQS